MDSSYPLISLFVFYFLFVPGFESRSPRIAQARIRLATDTLRQTPHRAGALCTGYARHSYSFLLQKIADSGYMYPLCWKGEKLSMILAHCIMYSWKISLCIFTSCGTKLHPVLLEVSILLWITSWILQSKTIYYYDVSFPYGFEFDLIGQESWVHTLVHHIPYYYSTLFSSHKGFAPLFL